MLTTARRPTVVLGGSGFIGSALRRRLAADGVPATILSRSDPASPPADNETWVVGDFAETQTVRAILTEGADVYHLISESTPAKGNWDVETDITRNVLPTLQLLKAAVDARVRKLIYVSSGGTVYGVPTAVPIPETAETNPISAYGIGKLAIEKYLLLFQRHHGLDVQILRVANPYGPGQQPNRQQGVVANLLYQGLTGAPFQIWGDGSVQRDFVHVDDVADSLIAASNYGGPHRVMNVGSGYAIAIAGIADHIEAALGLSGHPRIHHEARSFDVPVNYLDISLIRREAGWTPRTDWSKGLKATIGWMTKTLPLEFVPYDSGPVPSN